MGKLLRLEATFCVAANSKQAADQHTQSARLGNGRRRSIRGKAGLRAAIGSGSGAEVNGHAGELAGRQARRGQHERKGVNANHTVWRSLDVGEVEGENAELADVFVSEELIEA